MDHELGSDRSRRVAARVAIALCLAVCVVAIPAFAFGIPVTTCDPAATYNNSASISITATCSADPASNYVGTRYWFDASAPASVSAYPTTATVSISTVGTHTISFFSVDDVGNVEATQVKTFRINDTIKPVSRSDVSVVYLNSATINLAADDNVGGSGVSKIWYKLDTAAAASGSAVTATGYGTHNLSFWSVDVAGNSETTKTVSFFIEDTIKPTTISDVVTTYNNSATIKLTATDSSSGSGIAHTYWTLDGGPVTEGLTITTSAFGNHAIQYWSVDNQDNVEAPVSANFLVEDTVKPRTVSNIDAAYLDSASITLSATDACSGVAHTYFSLDGGPTTEGTSLVVTALGNHTLTFWSVDVAGNVEDALVAPFFIDETPKDTTAPSVTSDAKSTYASSPAVVKLTATEEADGSGIDTLYYKVDGGATVEVKPAALRAAATAPPITPTTTPPDGHFAMACTTCHVVTAAPPITEGDLPPAGHSDLACTTCHVVNPADGGGDGDTTGTPGAVMTLSANVSVSGDGAHSIEFWAKDVAGNVASHQTVSFTINSNPTPSDTIAPTTTSDAVATYVGSATIHLSATDNAGGSGVAHTYYKLDGDANAEGTAISVTSLGSHSLEFWSVDVAGNVETHHVANFVINEETHVPAATSITIRTNATTVARGKTFILSGLVSPDGLIGTNIQVMVKYPTKSFYSYSSLRTCYMNGVVPSWWYRYAPLKSQPAGVYKFYAFVPASTDFAASQSSVVSVSFK